MLLFEDVIVTVISKGALAEFPRGSFSAMISLPEAEVGAGDGCAKIVRANGEGPTTLTIPDPELNPEAEAVIAAMPGRTPVL
jgi:hypothetical protein